MGSLVLVDSKCLVSLGFFGTFHFMTSGVRLGLIVMVGSILTSGRLK